VPPLWESIRIIAVVTEMDSIPFLEHLGEPIQPRRLPLPEVHPTGRNADQRGVADVAMIESLPTYELDKRVSW